MNTRKINIFVALLSLVLAFTACQPEEFTLGKMFSKEDLNYSITQNPDDPNMIILESLTPGATPLWITPMGRSTRVKDTLKIPFEGYYEFTYGVMSAGGYVQADVYPLTLTTTNLMYVDDPLWTLLSGGVGEEKTWLLDLDADGVSKFFAGPLYFYGTDNGWLEGGDAGCYGDDCWNWNPDWPGNSWLMPAGDYGTMTFDLKGGANISVDHKMLGRVENGTYFLDADAKTLKMTDAGPLHDSGRDGQVVDWGDITVMSLTENTMQLAVLRDEALSGEGPTLLTYNFISKEYADNWVPEDLPDPEPELPAGWEDDISQVVSTEIKWVLSSETPFNWCALDGSFLNNWNLPEDYPEWTGFNASIPPSYANFSLTLNSDDHTAVFVAPDGTTENGTYSLDEKGIYTFEGVKPSFNIVSWVNLSTTEDNQWRIMQIEKDATGAIEGIWVGAKDPVKPEYMAYHLIPQFSGGEEDPLAAWKSALVGKTFIPDVNWFVDWVTSPPAFNGGWTSADTFGDDYTNNSWIWTADTRAVAEDASLYFFMDGSDIKCTKTQAGVSETSTVVIDPEAGTLTFGMELINYDGSPASWLPRGGDGVVWHFVPHGGSNLTNLATNGLWLGFENSKPGENDKPDGETTILHYVVQ